MATDKNDQLRLNSSENKKQGFLSTLMYQKPGFSPDIMSSFSFLKPDGSLLYQASLASFKGWAILVFYPCK